MAACDRLAEKQDKVRSPLLLGMREENHLLSMCGEVVGHSDYRLPIKSPMFLLSFKLHRGKKKKTRKEKKRKKHDRTDTFPKPVLPLSALILNFFPVKASQR